MQSLQKQKLHVDNDDIYAPNSLVRSLVALVLGLGLDELNLELVQRRGEQRGPGEDDGQPSWVQAAETGRWACNSVVECSTAAIGTVSKCRWFDSTRALFFYP